MHVDLESMHDNDLSDFVDFLYFKTVSCKSIFKTKRILKLKSSSLKPGLFPKGLLIDSMIPFAYIWQNSFIIIMAS